MRYHQKKTLLLNILDKLPAGIGYPIYYQFQKRSFNDLNAMVEPSLRSAEKMKEVLDNYGISLENEVVMEIGSGWAPIMPMLFKLEFSVAKVITYDINRHYTNKRIAQVVNYFKQRFETHEQKGLDIPRFIDYYPKTNVLDATLDKKTRLVFSRFVLEHVTPADIEAMHRKFYNELDRGVKIFHLISPSDHRAYSDKSLSYYDFLKYSQEEWDNIQTKFDYHNRLRLPEYIELFQRAGFKITHLDHDSVKKESDKYRKFKQLKLHPDYEKFKEEDILAGSICVLLEKDDRSDNLS